MTDPRLLADIQGAESCVLTAYKDSRGFWTIGWGHLLDQSKDWTGHTWTQAQADAQLTIDIDNAALDAENLPEWRCLDTDCRRNAAIELVFNMGVFTWHKFTRTRAAIQIRDWPTVHAELLASAWAGEVHAKRANRLANYLLTGVYP